MKQIVILALALFGLGVKAQTLIDPNLQQYSRQALVDGIKDFGDDVNLAVVIMEVTSGNVIATRVAGIVNVSPPDVINCRGCFAAAFFSYDHPRYTIGIFVNKHDRPAGRIIASKIAGNIIDYMIKQYLHLRHIDEAFLIEKNSHKFHPAEKGR